jgi:hypothetical protein
MAMAGQGSPAQLVSGTVKFLNSTLKPANTGQHLMASWLMAVPAY